ncbi:tetratricopeptide repeat protein [Pelotalea chapellei]|uniref:Tetratricopeptide repeat protein n=1 Tax=Pelotalea chapellei TaxID=44671 RepID=A0ABS5U7F9_9BACT|nr:tetratricopeptide repeat protein [Pelotalea chapellei]MBT1071602.1 tetratricopeptide repeat protein [Pelotalea chapellei]
MDSKTENQAAHNQVVQLTKRASQLLKNRNYAEARTSFEEALELAPDDPYILTGIGDALRQQKSFSGATVHYRRVLEIDPKNVFALRGLGDALRGQRLYLEAISCWKKYLQLRNHRDIFVLTRIADSYKTVNDDESSLIYYKKALALDGCDRYALMGLADLYHKKGQAASAVEHYEKALANGVTLINVLTIVAKLHWSLGNHEQAKLYFDKTLSRDPDNSYALYGLGNYFRWKCDYRKAIAVWEKILEKNSGTVNLMTRIGDAYRNLGEFDAAERAFRKNLDIAYDKFTMVGILKLYCLQGRLEEACGCYDELLRHEGEDNRFLDDVVALLIKHKTHDRALHLLRHAVQQHGISSLVGQVAAERIKNLEIMALERK